MQTFTKNSSYKIIRITDDNNIVLTFDTYYLFEKRNFDIINIPDDSKLIDIILANPDIDAIVIQFKDNKNYHLPILNTLPDYYKRRIYNFDAETNHGIELALKINESELSGHINPLFSFITPLYNTNIEYFKKTYISLCSQTINDWEWILVDDSPEHLDSIKDFLTEIKDVRVRYYRIAPTNGNIGLSKWRGNCMSKGKWLIELDHDDILMYWCLEFIKNAIEKFPNNKFIYSDNTTIDENDNVTPCQYGDNYSFGLGYGHSYDSQTPDNRTIRTDSSGPINNACIRHIVGVPNHFRCWERNFYFSIGGHNQYLRIADDYELLVRSFLKTRFTHIMNCCYAQRFDGNNSQYQTCEDSDGQGNIADIQRRVRLISIFYDKQIHERLIELGLNDDAWIEGDPYETAHVYEKLHLPDVCEDQYFPFEDKKSLGVFFLATSVYKDYFKTFAESLKNLFPNSNFNKHLIIMSDGLKEYDNYEIGGFKVHCYDVIDYPYPLVPMNKFQMVSKYMNDLNLDYGMFFDADSIILEKSNQFWNGLENLLKSGKLLCSGHPHYLYYPNKVLEEPLIVTNKDSVAYMNSELINKNKSYIITSFFAGKKEIITKYAKKIYDMIGKDLSQIRWIPQYVDEAYMNKIYETDVLLGNSSDIIKDKFITINPYTFGNFPERDNKNLFKNNFPEYENTIFINQKYNVGLKTKKKENLV